MKELFRRLWFAMHRAEFERDLEEEMRHHLALGAEERGGPQAARRQFGNVTLLKEESRAKILGLNAAKMFKFDVPAKYTA